jgi:hypothetical protein
MHASQRAPPRIQHKDEPDVAFGHVSDGGAKLIEHRL